jgi:hypothetical protein
MRSQEVSLSRTPKTGLDLSRRSLSKKMKKMTSFIIEEIKRNIETPKLSSSWWWLRSATTNLIKSWQDETILAGLDEYEINQAETTIRFGILSLYKDWCLSL